MNVAQLLPFPSAFDPPQQAEGSLDPLGLYSIADAMGVRLAPGVRERQSRPRYLTLALVGFAVCQGIEEQVPDRQVPVWLVYEWLVVTALVRQLQGTPELQGIPGRDKVKECLDRGEAVCASNYLKTPSVFGFHGIYRVFGVKAGLFDAAGHPLAAGQRVLEAWQKDNGLSGFFTADGDAGRMRQQIRQAVLTGVRTGRLEPLSGALCAWIAAHLHPHRLGAAEREALWAALTRSDPLRGEYADLLTAARGQEAWLAGEKSEAAYHTCVLPHASLPMQQLLRTIQAFERVARLLMDAFDEARWRMAAEVRPVDAAWLAGGACMQRAANAGAAAFRDALTLLGEIDPAAQQRLQRGFEWMAEPAGPAAFAQRLLAHHEQVQRAKPPNGKRAWFDTFGDGRMAVRPAYALDEFESQEEQYVHAYRTWPIWKFSLDLGRAQREQA